MTLFLCEIKVVNNIWNHWYSLEVFAGGHPPNYYLADLREGRSHCGKGD